MSDNGARLRIAVLSDINRALVPMHDLDTIFFEASLKKSFASPAERGAFRERWLGRYVTAYPGQFLVALLEPCNGQARMAGYLAGCFDDPATAAQFADISYFKDIQDLTAMYPAHLHINVARDQRGSGIGERLIETFCGLARAQGLSGVHVVTGAGSRNRPFYKRCGFEQLREFQWNGVDVVALGRMLDET